MNLLNKNVQTITFENVVDFCKNDSSPEGPQLDYKKDRPSDMVKHFSSFSNTLGGLIIVGVDEDEKTGKPKAWDGIDRNKDIEWVHQAASQVVPLPEYDVAITDEGPNNKIFLLIRIYEGTRPPYVTQFSPTVWLRTGNVSTKLPYEQARREDLLQLINKSSDLSLRRNLAHSTMTNHFEALIKASTREHLESLSAQNTPPNIEPYLRPPNLIQLHIMPHDPNRKLFNPRDLLSSRAIVDLFGNTGRLATLAYNAAPLPKGLARLEYQGNPPRLEALQFYDNGAVMFSSNVAHRPPGNKTDSIAIKAIFNILIDVLIMSRKLYAKIPYSGTLDGSLNLDVASDAILWRMSAQTGDYADSFPALLPHYHLPIQLDTSILNDNDVLTDYLIDICETLHWHLGNPGPGREVIKQSIKLKLNISGS